MDLKIEGTVETLLPVMQGVSANGKEWMKQEVVLLTDGGQYERRMAVTIMGQERIDKFNLHEGEKVTMHLDIDAREYKGRWYNSINVWKVDKEGGQKQAPQQQQAPQQSAQQGQTPQGGDIPSDDLPF